MSTVVDEDELLNVPEDQQQAIEEMFDVDELLGPSEGSKEEASTEQASQGGNLSEGAAEDNLVTETSTTAAVVDESFEREELDYEEDDDEEHKEERTGRFTSERKPADATPPTSTNNIDKVEGRRQSSGENRNHNNNQKQWRNGSGRGNGRGRGNNGHRYRGGPNMQYGGPMRMQQGPGMVNGPTPLLSLNTQGLYPPSGGKILINPNFRGPMGPPGPGPLGPAGVLPLVGAPSVLPTIVPGQGPIIPRLPNGIPLTGLPSNHGAAGFGPPPSNRPQMPPPIMPGMNTGISRPAPVVQWDQAVEAFLSGSTRHRSPHRRHHRSSSYSSYSSYSSRSRSAGSSRSRSPRRRRENRGGSNRPRNQRDRGGRGGNSFRGRAGQNRRDLPRREPRDNKQISVECAKAVGLDNEYLSKLEDQRRKRDEVLRRKEQRRFGGGGNNNEQSSSSQRQNDRNDRGGNYRQSQQRDRRSNEGPSNNDQRRSGNGPNMSSAQSNTKPSSEAEAALRKNKAYLCVNVKNVKQLTTAKMRVETLAKDLGEIRKCWKSNEDQVTVIFVEHSKAKEFMLKYNNKVLSGLRIQVGLEKAYLNLAEIQ